MASHYVSLNKGEEGLKMSDFTVGTSSTAGDVFELRVLDGAAVKHLDVERAILAFKRYFENVKQANTDGFDVTT